jgi:putative lipoprotein
MVNRKKREGLSMKPKFLLLIFASFLIVACSQTEMLRMRVDEFNSTDWVLEEIGGSAVVDRVQSTLRFQGNDRIVGWGGCNRYFANVRSGRNFIEVGPIGSTRRICPPVVMDQEERFFHALQKARSIRMEGDYLVIDSEGIEKPLKFGRLKKSGS